MVNRMLVLLVSIIKKLKYKPHSLRYYRWGQTYDRVMEAKRLRDFSVTSLVFRELTLVVYVS